MHVEELRCREETQVQGKKDGVCLVRGEGCAEEDDDDEEEARKVSLWIISNWIAFNILLLDSRRIYRRRR